MDESDNPYAAPTASDETTGADKDSITEAKAPLGVVVSLSSLVLISIELSVLTVFLFSQRNIGILELGVFVFPGIVAGALFFSVLARIRFARLATVVIGIGGGLLLITLAVPVLFNFLSRIQQGALGPALMTEELVYRILEWVLIASCFAAAIGLLGSKSKRWYRGA